MPINENVMSLENIGGGAAIEKFDLELERVMDNIGDINTDPKAVREINLKFKFRPDERREHIAIEIISDSKLVKLKPFVISAIASGKGAHEIVAPKQMPLPENVTPIAARKE